jgi:5-(carboxyamino)imidazole ribonucleotide synthase
MNARLGIVGAGQLGLYLCEAAQALGIQVSVISDTADAPALQVAETTFVGDLDNIPLVSRFLSSCDVITFDKEDVPGETLDYLLQAEHAGRVTINPGAEILLRLKDKALQKTWLKEHGLPTLPFYVLSGNTEPLEFPEGKFAGALVQKARCGGYDGRGVQLLESLDSMQQLWNVPSIVEPYLPNCREISVLTVRARDGEMMSYPPVGMEFDSQLNSVKTVVMPAQIDELMGEQACALAERAVSSLEGVGLFAVEMFITDEDELLINEISPRVHNSGHLTLDACNVSQFEQHVRAVMGLPLVAIECESAAVMLNLLYSEYMREYCPERPLVSRETGARAAIYWYGKAAGKAGRKMGHINAVATSVAEALLLADGAMAGLKPGQSGHAA